MSIVSAWNKLEDAAVNIFNNIGGFKLDARVRNFPTSGKADELFDRILKTSSSLKITPILNKTIPFFDSTGLTNKNFLERYNFRHPEDPISSPFEDNTQQPS